MKWNRACTVGMLILTLALPGWAAVIGDFEGSFEAGWSVSGGNNPTAEPSTNWASSGSYSMKVTPGTNVANNFDFGRIYVYDELGTTLIVPGEILSFTGASGTWLPAVVPLPAAALGQRVRLEFMLFSDQIYPEDGWYIDDVEVK